MDISVQMFCSRNFPPLRDICKDLGEIGYTQVEGFGGLFDDVDGLKAALDAGGLKMTSSHIGFDMIENETDRVLKIAETLGLKKVFIPFLQADERPTDDAGWRAMGERAAAAGRPLQEAGLVFGWHNHDFELFETSTGARPLELIAEAGVDLELDLGWVGRAGLDPVEYIQKYADRIKTVHVKDIAPKGESTDEDGWADVGHGTFDWPAIHAALQAIGVDHYVAEHDNPNDHHRFASRSLAAIQAL